MKEKIKGVLKTKEFYFCLFLVLANVVFLRRALFNRGIDGTRILLPIQLLIELLLLYLFHRFKNLPLEKLFLALALPLGLIFIFIMPFGMSPDEFTHFTRIYGISEGVLIAPQSEENSGGSELPAELDEIYTVLPESGTYDEISKDLSIGKSGEKKEYNYVTAALYNPICYLPQVLGVLTGKILNLPYLAQAYLARIFNFACFLCLVFFALKYLPKYRKFMIFILFFPITLQETTSLAPDALTISLTFFLISFVLYLATNKKHKMNKKELAILYILAALLGFCKIIYLPLLLLYFIIPKDCFGDKNKKLFHAIMMIAMVLILNVIWLSISSRYLVNVRDGVSPNEQVSFILTHPFNYLTTLIGTLNAELDFYLTSVFGMSLGHFSINLPRFYFYLFVFISILTLAENIEKIKLDLSSKIIILATFLAIILLIFTSLYIQWTPLKNLTVVGVQGRYFLPILPLLPVILSFARKREKTFELISEKTVLLFSVFANICALTCILVANL